MNYNKITYTYKEQVFVLSLLIIKNDETPSARLKCLFPAGPNVFF